MSRKGSLEVITGCMYSGKTEELIRRVRRALIGGLDVQVFKSHLDTRFSLEEVMPHQGPGLKANMVQLSACEHLAREVSPDADVVAIDEIQFFDPPTAIYLDQLANKGRLIIVAGLDLDFRGEPWLDGPMPELMCRADRVDKLTAICVECGGLAEATRTQRHVNGMPAQWTDPQELVAAKSIYTAVCRNHLTIDRPDS